MNRLIEQQGGSVKSAHKDELQTRSGRHAIEKRAFLWALLCGAVSLGGGLLMASPIQKMTSWAFFAAEPSSEVAASPQLLAQGAGYFAQSCADCHGDDGHGDEGPDLHNLTISNARIASQIKNGTKGEMPSFAKKYHDPEITALIAYLRSLR
jgi:mono/diheme cytochrome c family protein